MSSIDGVSFHPASIIADERGAVLHMLRSDNDIMGQFGEIYFSEVNAGQLKAWKCHRKMTQRLCVPSGSMRFVLYDARPSSSSFQQIMEVNIGRERHYGVLIIPPQVWYGFKNEGEGVALVANCPDMAHDPSESMRLPVDSSDIPYQWGVVAAHD